MFNLCIKRLIGVCSVWAALQFTCGKCSAQINSWTNPVSANWEEPYWSLGILPNSTQMVMITNDGYKAVGIFPSTVLNFPNSLTVSNLTISAPTNAFSTLLLNYSGTATPLRVLNGCTISTNGSLDNLYGAFEVDSGQWNITSGQFIQEGGTTVATNATTSVLAGSMNLTNADVNLGDLDLGDSFTISGTVVQAGGSVDCALVVHGGSYSFLSGTFSGECSVLSPFGVGYFGYSTFNQYSGTNYAVISLGTSPRFPFGSGFGTYTLYNGAVVTSNVDIGRAGYAHGEFNQAEGFVSIASLNLGGGIGGGGTGTTGVGTYSLTNGILLTGNLNIANGSIIQAGGQHTTTNALVLGLYSVSRFFASYSLSGGEFFCPGIYMGTSGFWVFYTAFYQSGGTNSVAGDLIFDDTGYSLSGGTLLTSNTVVLQGGIHSQFLQTGGEHRVSNTLSNLDQYFLSGGTLSASNIVLSGTLSVSNSAVILNPGLFNFGGNLQLFNNANENLGQMLLSSNSSIDLEPGTHTLAFLNSSSIAWGNGVTLTVSNWTGLANGGGSDQLLFGSNSSGLTQAQLHQIQFVNPSGFPVGVYPAQMLATGEVVPAPLPMLLSSRNRNGFILNWSDGFVLQSATNLQGPYSDVTSATSPYTNLGFQLPQQFFRLRQ